jgi:ubiquinone/menaquinone biosynthesis C-methylase UbiE
MSEQAFKFSGEAARNYDEYLGPFLFEPSARIMASYLPEHYEGSVLEMAAGTGRLTRHLSRRMGLTGMLVVTDISPDMLEVAQEKLPSLPIDFKVADAEALPFEDNSFDMVFFQYGIMFLPEKAKGMAEAFRVLKPGGKLFMSTWDATHRIPFMKLWFDEILLPFFTCADKSKYLVPFHMHDPVHLEQLFSAAGFKNISIENRHFQGTSPAPSELVKGFLLKHSMAKEVMEQDPDALMPLADKFQSGIIERFGAELVRCELSAFFCQGEK